MNSQKTKRLVTSYKLMNITRLEFSHVLNMPVRRIHSYLAGDRQISDALLRNVEKLAKKMDKDYFNLIEKRLKKLKGL